MPLNHGGRLNHYDHLQKSRPQPVEPDPNQAINREKPGASRPLAAQDGELVAEDGELVAERDDLELQFYAAAKPTGEPCEEFQKE